MLKVEYLISSHADALDIFFVVACSVLFAIVYISSYYDERLRIAFKKSSKVETAVKDHYKTAPPTLGMDMKPMNLTDDYSTWLSL